MNFDAAFDLLLKHEGGYSDHAADPGGKTRFGITEAVAREVGYRDDMRELPLDEMDLPPIKLPEVEAKDEPV